MLEKEELSQIIEQLEKIEQELGNLKNRIFNLKYIENIEYLFNKLYEITNTNIIASVIFIDNNDIKFILKGKVNGDANVIIINNKMYYWYDYDIDVDNHVITFKYSTKYNVPNELLELLRKIPENNIGYADVKYIRLYCLLKKGYKINFA